nr:M15 family metallopeptidase [Lachnospiraceae bacterium]
MSNYKWKRVMSGLLILCVVTTTAFTSILPVWADETVSQNSVSVNHLPEETEEVSANETPECVNSDTEIEEQTQVQTQTLGVSDNDTPQKEEKITVAQVTGVSAVSKTYTSLEIKYAPVAGSEGYEIYRGTSQGSMTLLADRAKTQTSYTDKKLTTGKKYYYKVRAYVYGKNKEKIYGGFSTVVSAKPMLTAPVIASVKSSNYKTVTINYSKVTGANGYVIYRSTKKNSGYKKIATIKKGKTVKYTDKKCTTGKKYYYKVRAYRKVSGKRVYSNYSVVKTGTAKLSKSKFKNVTVVSADTALLSWKKVSGASGYYIYRSTAKNGKYKKVLHAKTGKTTQAYVSGHENGKTYYYKVRAYRKVKGKKKYSDYSKVVGATFNRLASSDETYTQKAQRIFGLDYYKKYGSKAEAELHMKTITIQVWDFASDGVTKVTKTKKLTVHKNIADTVQQIFKEIYEGKEKFPIKNVGGYSWRGDSSRSEHCCGLAIDINWEENYLIDNGVIISGKLYQPGVNPYSIPTDGEVANIMKKYGFSQGIWGNRCDYMHFSYFGT